MFNTVLSAMHAAAIAALRACPGTDWQLVQESNLRTSKAFGYPQGALPMI